MAGQRGAEPAVGEVEEQVEQAAAPQSPPAKSPYDDMLCTICNLKACWQTPDAGGAASTKG